VNGFRDGAQIHRALAWFFAAVAFVSVYAMAQVWACSSSAPLPQWVAWALCVKLEACRATWPIRGKGFFSIYMTLAGTLSTAIALLAATLLGASRHRRWLVAPTLLAVIGLGLTLVRGAWLGCAVAVGLLASLTRRLGPVQGPLQEDLEPGGIERLGQVVVGAFFHGLDRALDRPLAREHDHGGLGVVVAQR